MWTEARLRPQGGGPWFGDQFREFAAEALDGRAPKRLFWMEDDVDNRPLNGTPTITFIGTRNFVGMRAMARTTAEEDQEEARQDAVLMLGSILKLAQAMDSRFGHHHGIEILQGSRRITESSWTSYRIRTLVIPRCRTRKHQSDWLAAMPGKGMEIKPLQDAFQDVVKNVILSDLREIFPTQKNLFINGLNFLESPLWCPPIRVGGGTAFAVQNVVFSLPHRITGPVQVGSLRTRGYGDINRAMRGGDKDG